MFLEQRVVLYMRLYALLAHATTPADQLVGAILVGRAPQAKSSFWMTFSRSSAGLEPSGAT
jgi:hypothetical protein